MNVADEDKKLIKLLGRCILQFVMHVVVAAIVGITLSLIIIAFQWKEFVVTLEEGFNIKVIFISIWVVIMPLLLITLNYKNALMNSVSIIISGKREACIKSIISSILEKDPEMKFLELEQRERQVVNFILNCLKLPFPFNSMIKMFLVYVGFDEKLIEVVKQIDELENCSGDRVELISSEMVKIIPNDLLKPSYVFSMVIVFASIAVAFI